MTSSNARRHYAGINKPLAACSYFDCYRCEQARRRVALIYEVNPDGPGYRKFKRYNRFWVRVEFYGTTFAGFWKKYLTEFWEAYDQTELGPTHNSRARGNFPRVTPVNRGVLDTD